MISFKTPPTHTAVGVPEVDLSHLTEEERLVIQSVMQKAQSELGMSNEPLILEHQATSNKVETGPASLTTEASATTCQNTTSGEGDLQPAQTQTAPPIPKEPVSNPSELNQQQQTIMPANQNKHASQDDNNHELATRTQVINQGRELRANEPENPGPQAALNQRVVEVPIEQQQQETQFINHNGQQAEGAHLPAFQQENSPNGGFSDRMAPLEQLVDQGPPMTVSRNEIDGRSSPRKQVVRQLPRPKENQAQARRHTSMARPSKVHQPKPMSSNNASANDNTSRSKSERGARSNKTSARGGRPRDPARPTDKQQESRRASRDSSESSDQGSSRAAPAPDDKKIIIEEKELPHQNNNNPDCDELVEFISSEQASQVMQQQQELLIKQSKELIKLQLEQQVLSQQLKKSIKNTVEEFGPISELVKPKKEASRSPDDDQLDEPVPTHPPEQQHQKQRASRLRARSQTSSRFNKSRAPDPLVSPVDTTDSDLEPHSQPRRPVPRATSQGGGGGGHSLRSSSQSSSRSFSYAYNNNNKHLVYSRRREPIGLPPAPLPVAAAIRIHSQQQHQIAANRIQGVTRGSNFAQSQRHSRSVSSSPLMLNPGHINSGYVSDYQPATGTRASSPDDTMSELGGCSRRRKRLPATPSNAIPVTPSMVRKIVEARRLTATMHRSERRLNQGRSISSLPGLPQSQIGFNINSSLVGTNSSKRLSLNESYLINYELNSRPSSLLDFKLNTNNTPTPLSASQTSKPAVGFLKSLSMSAHDAGDTNDIDYHHSREPPSKINDNKPGPESMSDKTLAGHRGSLELDRIISNWDRLFSMNEKPIAASVCAPDHELKLELNRSHQSRGVNSGRTGVGDASKSFIDQLNQQYNDHKAPTPVRHTSLDYSMSNGLAPFTFLAKPSTSTSISNSSASMSGAPTYQLEAPVQANHWNYYQPPNQDGYTHCSGNTKVAASVDFHQDFSPSSFQIYSGSSSKAFRRDDEITSRLLEMDQRVRPTESSLNYLLCDSGPMNNNNSRIPLLNNINSTSTTLSNSTLLNHPYIGRQDSTSTNQIADLPSSSWSSVNQAAIPPSRLDFTPSSSRRFHLTPTRSLDVVDFDFIPQTSSLVSAHPRAHLSTAHGYPTTGPSLRAHQRGEFTANQPEVISSCPAVQPSENWRFNKNNSTPSWRQSQFEAGPQNLLDLYTTTSSSNNNSEEVGQFDSSSPRHFNQDQVVYRTPLTNQNYIHQHQPASVTGPPVYHMKQPISSWTPSLVGYGAAPNTQSTNHALMGRELSPSSSAPRPDLNGFVSRTGDRVSRQDATSNSILFNANQTKFQPNLGAETPHFEESTKGGKRGISNGNTHDHHDPATSSSFQPKLTKDDIIKGGPKFDSIGYRFRTSNQNKYLGQVRASSHSPISRYPDPPYKRILLSKNPKDRIGNGIGISIIGGLPMPSVYDAINKCILTSGAFVNEVFQNSNVFFIGEMFKGDQIIEWNGVNLCNRSNEEVQQILLSQFSDEEVEIIYLPQDRASEAYTHRNGSGESSDHRSNDNSNDNNNFIDHQLDYRQREPASKPSAVRRRLSLSSFGNIWYK